MGLINFLNKNKKASFFFILDMFLGSFILLITLILVFSFTFSEPELDNLQTKLNGFTTIVFKSPISSYSNDVLSELTQNENLLINPDMTMDEFVYFLVLNGKINNATSLIASMSSLIIPSNMGLRYVVNNTEIYIQNEDKMNKSNALIADRKITFKVFNSTSYLDKTITEVEIWQ